MRAYVIITGIVFALLSLAHVWRIFGENRQLATQPDFVIITLASAALSPWAWRVLRTAPRS